MTVLNYASGTTKNQIKDDKFNLLGIRMVTFNAIVNPGLYVVFRKENVLRVRSVVKKIEFYIKRRSSDESKPILEIT